MCLVEQRVFCRESKEKVNGSRWEIPGKYYIRRKLPQNP
jgi:hypothetical protein